MDDATVAAALDHPAGALLAAGALRERLGRGPGAVGEPQQVGDARDEPAARPPRHRVVRHGVGAVLDRPRRDRLGSRGARRVEADAVEAARLEDVRAHRRLERRAGHPLDRGPDDPVAGVRVHPELARGTEGAEPGAGDRLRDRGELVERPLGLAPEPAEVREQLPRRRGPGGRLERLVEVEHRLRERGRERLRDRGDAEGRVRRERLVAVDGGDAPGPDGRVPVGEHPERQAWHAPAGAFLARERVDGCERAFDHSSLLPYRATVAAAVRVLPSRRAGVTESSESEVQ